MYEVGTEATSPTNNMPPRDTAARIWYVAST
jgi:hypothetical protein